MSSSFGWNLLEQPKSMLSSIRGEHCHSILICVGRSRWTIIVTPIHDRLTHFITSTTVCLLFLNCRSYIEFPLF